jgi:hypothetical protein
VNFSARHFPSVARSHDGDLLFLAIGRGNWSILGDRETALALDACSRWLGGGHTAITIRRATLRKLPESVTGASSERRLGQAFRADRLTPLETQPASASFCPASASSFRDCFFVGLSPHRPPMDFWIWSGWRARLGTCELANIHERGPQLNRALLLIPPDKEGKLASMPSRANPDATRGERQARGLEQGPRTGSGCRAASHRSGGTHIAAHGSRRPESHKPGLWRHSHGMAFPESSPASSAKVKRVVAVLRLR